jgi:cell division septation protein DedD
MSATPSSFTNAAPSSAPARKAELGIMTELYGLLIGPVRGAYYQRKFQTFESLGKTLPTWNAGAAFFTLTWLIARKLWGPAFTYMLWWGGIHDQVPRAVENSICALGILLLFALPGYLGNGLYYHHVRDRTIDALATARSLTVVREQLAAQGVTLRWIRSVVGAHVAILALLALWWWSQSWNDTPAPEAVVAQATVGAPHLVIPPVRSVPASAYDDEPPAATPAPVAPPAPAPSVTAPAAPAAPAPVASSNRLVRLIEETPEAARPEPTATSSALPPVDTRPLAAGKFYVSAGVYAQRSNAARAARSLKEANIAFMRHNIASDKGTLTGLRVGPFPNRQQAQLAEAKVRRLGIDTSVFQQPRN